MIEWLGQATWPEESLCQEWAQTLNDLELPRFTRRWLKWGNEKVAWLVNKMDLGWLGGEMNGVKI